MKCHKCGKERATADFYFHKNAICRPCKECKKQRVKLKKEKILAWRRKYSTTVGYRKNIREFRKRQRMTLADEYVKRLLKRRIQDAEVLQLKRNQLKLFRAIHERQIIKSNL